MAAEPCRGLSDDASGSCVHRTLQFVKFALVCQTLPHSAGDAGQRLVEVMLVIGYHSKPFIIYYYLLLFIMPVDSEGQTSGRAQWGGCSVPGVSAGGPEQLRARIVCRLLHPRVWHL